MYPEEKVAQIQGNHRFLQCAKCCIDETWDGVKPVEEMIKAMGEDTAVPTELIPRCPHCGSPMQVHMEMDRNFIPAEIRDKSYGLDGDLAEILHGLAKKLGG